VVFARDGRRFDQLVVSLKPRPLIIPDGRIVRFQLSYEFDFLCGNVSPRTCVGVPDDLAPNCEVPSLLNCEILSNQIIAGTAKIVDVVVAILPNINLSVWVGDLVDDHHAAIHVCASSEGKASVRVPILRLATTPKKSAMAAKAATQASQQFCSAGHHSLELNRT
jgi:hypothetical protein